jgi:dethiobiotin synthetase
MNYFVTGTDTGVGKTLVSCALLHAFAARGKRVAGMKPVAAGCDDDGINEDVKRLRSATTVFASLGQINPYSFIPAIAPHLAAKRNGVAIQLERILESYHELTAQADVVIVEGAGGWMVPLNETQNSVDLVTAMELPVILVVGMRLGCLNHALLTELAIKQAKLVCAGWVANVLDANMDALDDNISALQQRIKAPLLGVIPYQENLDAQLTALQLNIDLLKRNSDAIELENVT